jgi:hypothetical protein
MPVEFGRMGIRSVEWEVQGAACLLRYDRRWYGAWAPGQYLRGRAAVEADGDGTRVRVMVDYQLRNLVVGALGVVSSSLVAVAVIGPSALYFALLVCGAAGLHYLWLRGRTRRLERQTDYLADYLVRRIEAAVVEASRADLVAHAS